MSTLHNNTYSFQGCRKHQRYDLEMLQQHYANCNSTCSPDIDIIWREGNSIHSNMVTGSDCYQMVQTQTGDDPRDTQGCSHQYTPSGGGHSVSLSPTVSVTIPASDISEHEIKITDIIIFLKNRKMEKNHFVQKWKINRVWKSNKSDRCREKERLCYVRSAVCKL